MPVYQITYNTSNTYSDLVHEAILEFLVLPSSDNDQEILNQEFQTQPNISSYSGKNIFGFEVLRFRLRGHVDAFHFSLKGLVKKEVTNPFGFVPLTIEEERSYLYSEDFLIDHYLYLGQNQMTILPAEFPTPVIKPYEGVFEFIQRINKFVHNQLTYDHTIKDPHRTLTKTLSEKKGVCQDFAHLMIAIIRKNSIPCRYVSGYLNQGNNLVGTGAVHAWIQVLIPGIGWIGFDPTNNLLEDHHYIKIAHGLDINDCTTLKGVIKGAGTNKTEYSVTVKEQSKSMNQ